MVEVAQRLPVGPIGRHGLGSWGVGALVASEAALFGYLLFSYYYTAAVAGPGWVLERSPTLKLALPNTIILLLSSVAAWMGERGVLRRRGGLALTGFAVALALGLVFFVIQIIEWRSKPYHLGDSSYSSLYFVTTGFHMAHVAVGLLILIALFAWTLLDYFSPRRNLSVSAGVLYWHFVDIVWLFVFATYYLSPYLGFGT